jgi:Tol biopolymer transport system component
VVQAEKQEHMKIRFSHALTPGAGVLNDLWLIDLQDNRASLLREVKDERGTGTLHPHFSEDGRKLSWSEMEDKAGFKKGKELGYWKLMVADFSLEKGSPRLDNVRAFTPGGHGFYENHGFSPGGKKLLYTNNSESKRFGNNIYVLDLGTEKATRLTDGDYNEHAIFSPDGKRIVWISTTGNDKGGTDYWIMNADGSEKRRLTFFNQKGHPHYAGRRVVVADFAWSPDGKSFAGYYRAGGAIESVKDEIQIVTVDLTPDIPAEAR